MTQSCTAILDIAPKHLLGGVRIFESGDGEYIHRTPPANRRRPAGSRFRVYNISMNTRKGGEELDHRVDPRDRTVMSVCASLLASKSSDRSMPRKLFCGSSDSMPTCCSSGPSFRIHWTRNSVFLDPRCTPMMVPGCNCVRRVQLICAPVGVMSTVCANWATLSTEILVDTPFSCGAIYVCSGLAWTHLPS